MLGETHGQAGWGPPGGTLALPGRGGGPQWPGRLTPTRAPAQPGARPGRARRRVCGGGCKLSVRAQGGAREGRDEEVLRMS